MLSTYQPNELDTIAKELMNAHISAARSEIVNTEAKRFAAAMSRFWDAINQLAKKRITQFTPDARLELLEPFLFSLVHNYLKQIESEKDVHGWNSVMAFLAKFDLNSNKLSLCGRITFIRIRHEFYANFFRPLVNLHGMNDELDLLLQNINNRKEIPPEAYDRLQELLIHYHYISPKAELTKDDMKILQPAMAALVSVNLFTKINLIRLVSEVRQEDYLEGEFYQKPTIGYQILSDHIVTLHQFNILNQRNIELTFAFSRKFVGRRFTPDMAERLENFKKYAVEKHINKYNDLFSTFLAGSLNTKLNITTRQFEEYVFNATDAERILHADNNDFSKTLAKVISQDMRNSINSESGTSTDLIQKNVGIDEAELKVRVEKYSEDISSMLVTLHEEDGVNSKNIYNSIRHAEHIKEINKAFRLFREVESKQTPQETFDSLLTVSAQAEHISAMFQWLPEDQRTPDLCDYLIENADYLQDLREVCEYEIDKFKAYNESKEDCSAAFIFTRNLKYRKEYLNKIRLIYQFFKDKNIDNNHYVFNLSNNSYLAYAIADELEKVKELSINDLAELSFNKQRENKDNSKLKWHDYYEHVYDTCKNEEEKLRREKIKNISSVPELKSMFGNIAHPNFDKNHYSLLHNYAINFIDFVDSHFILHKHGLLKEWADVIKFYPEYSIEIAVALVEFKRFNLLDRKYVDLITKRMEYTGSIKEIIIKLDEWGILDKSLPALEKNLFRAPELARKFRNLDGNPMDTGLLALPSEEVEKNITNNMNTLFYYAPPAAISGASRLETSASFRINR